MQTVFLTEPGRLLLADIPEPTDPRPGHALVRVHRVGVCGTDMHAYRGRQTFFTYPRILGHELGVEVIALNPDDDEPVPPSVGVGDRCAVEAYLSCGHCIACRQGKTNCCARLQYLGVHVDGGMRPQLEVPIAKLHVSSRLTFDQLALVEMLTIGAHAVDRGQVGLGENVLVIGAGPIGLTVMQFAQAAGGRVIAIDMDAHRLAFCRERLGVPHTVEAGDEALGVVRGLTDGDLPTVVFDATGSPQSMNGALAFVAQGGRVVFVGHHPFDIVLSDPEFHRREATLYASRNSTAADYRRVIAQVESGRVDTDPWITHRAALADVVEVFSRWLEPKARVIKAMIAV